MRQCRGFVLSLNAPHLEIIFVLRNGHFFLDLLLPHLLHFTAKVMFNCYLV